MGKKSLAVGIDIGGTKTAFGIVNKEGSLLRKGCMPTTGHLSIEAYILALKAELSAWITAAGPEQIAGLGVGAPNANFYTGEIKEAVNLPWKGTINLVALLEEAFGYPTVVTNDANAAALGEMHYGAARSMKDFVVITLGTGLGSGIVANGQLIYGHDGFAGELGHIIAVRGGRRCGCGRQGCLERYVSATGIVATAKEWLEEGNSGSVLSGMDPLTAKDIHEAAVQGDELAKKLFSYTGQVLGETLADVVAITSPEAFIFFGGLSGAGDLLLQPAKAAMEENLLHVYRDKVKFLTSALPAADAAILGASALVWT